jgi:hypothetical protein
MADWTISPGDWCHAELLTGDREAPRYRSDAVGPPVGATRANRRALGAAKPILSTAFLTGTWRLLKLLAEGRDPGADILLVM